MLEAKASYYEYRKKGGVQITYDVKFDTPEDLSTFLDKVLGPVVAPPEVGEDGMLKEKKEVERPADVDLSQQPTTHPNGPIKEKKETS